MMAKRLSVLLTCLSLLSGCYRSYVNVTSEPPGAEIIKDGLRTGVKTPATLSPFSGSMTVGLEGHETPRPYAVERRVAGGRIAVTVLIWPVGAILWGFQFVKAEQNQYHFELKPMKK